MVLDGFLRDSEGFCSFLDCSVGLEGSGKILDGFCRDHKGSGGFWMVLEGCGQNKLDFLSCIGPAEWIWVRSHAEAEMERAFF